MANGQSPDFPAREQPLDPETGLFVPRLLTWFRNLRQQVDSTPSQVATPVEASNQSAAIGTTPIPTDPLAPGNYRVSGYIRITVPAGVSSSVACAIAWVDGGVTCTATLVPAVTGNATTATGTGTLFIRVDATTPISYSTSYASNPAAAMAYDLVLVLEQIGS